MNTDSIKKNISASFLVSSKKDWIDVATNELGGGNPLEKLKKSVYGLTVYPYYDVSDQVITPFQLSLSKDSYKSNRAWENLSVVHFNNPTRSNQEALLALQSGADGILFLLGEELFSEILLKNIQWQHCSLHFFANPDHKTFFLSLQQFASKQSLNPKELAGSIFWKSSPEDVLNIIHSFAEFEKFQCLGICLEEDDSKQKMIANALTQAVYFLDIASNNNIPIAQVIRQITFSVPIGTNFFIEIATLKTLRRLWYQIINAYDSTASYKVHIHAHSTAFTQSQFQPHANLIKSSTSALAAVVGGCDSLSIESEDQKNATLLRIARNVSSILLEESHLGIVADPTAGSYYLENLMDQLAKSAWQLFQKQVTK